MISKNKIKLIKSLAQKKYRIKENLFLVEGNKMVNELLASDFDIKTIICTKQFSDSNKNILSEGIETIITSQQEIQKVSLLKTPQQALAVCSIPVPKYTNIIPQQLTLLLDGVQDPGNLGTIIRIADWYGISTIYASPATADIFNPKVIQASMGAFLRVNLCYIKPEEILLEAKNNNIPIYGTFLEGENIYEQTLTKEGIIIMGNEGKGISHNLEKFISQKILIPSFPTGQKKNSESLNVSIATAIVCSEFKRREFIK